MNKKDKNHRFTYFPIIIRRIFFVAIIFFFAFWIIANILFPSERDIISTDCRLFEAEWERILDNGEHVPVDAPGKVSAAYGESVTLTTNLPQNIHNDEYLCFRLIWQDIEIYVDGILRQSYNTKDSRPFGTNSPTRYVFLDLEETDAGKELTYHFSSNSKYAGDIREIYIGDRLSIWLFLLGKSVPRTIIAFTLFLFSIICIIVCSILRFVYKKSLSLNLLAWTIFFCAFWMLSEIEFKQLIFKNISVLSYYPYWSLMLIPFPLLLYINEIQNARYQKIYTVPLTYASFIFITETILQVFDIAQFVDMLIYIHVGLLTSIVCIITTITIDTFKKRLSEYLYVGIGIYGMLLSAILELVLYYFGATLSLGTVLAIGLLFLLLMAVFKTGQDLLHTENKKQQAIMARDAQAKFLANMSHEIRTPINAIIGMNEMILRENESDAVQEYARNIQSASNMLLGLINDVLDFSKIESGQLELVEDTYNLGSLLLDEMLLLDTRTAGKPISTLIEIDPNLPSDLLGDELRIKQVLTNLISNAAKYTEHGTVTLKAFNKQTDENTIELCFSVTDTGIGIKEEDLSKLFDSFKRLELNKNRTIQGTGLGLNIAKQLVDLMHGSITVESTYGKGSTFTVSIPQQVINKHPIGNLEAMLDKRRTEKHTQSTLFTAPNATVLIVDDNAMNLSLMKGLLKRTQMNIDLATSGKKCLELTKQKQYDIIFMDHMMPELDGVETLHLLRAEHANPNRKTTVIALTANAIAGCREMYLEYGFNDYFPKPVQADKLDAFLLQYLPRTLIQMEDIPMDSYSASEDPVSIEPPVFLQQEAPTDLLYIDHETGLSYCMHSEDFYREVLADFCTQARQYVTMLDTYLQNHDWENYAIIAHSLKGSAINIGAGNFSNLSLQHELAAKENNSVFIVTEYANYIETLEKLIHKIEKINGVS